MRKAFHCGLSQGAIKMSSHSTWSTWSRYITALILTVLGSLSVRVVRVWLGWEYMQYTCQIRQGLVMWGHSTCGYPGYVVIPTLSLSLPFHHQAERSGLKLVAQHAPEDCFLWRNIHLVSFPPEIQLGCMNQVCTCTAFSLAFITL